MAFRNRLAESRRIPTKADAGGAQRLPSGCAVGITLNVAWCMSLAVSVRSNLL